MTILIGSLIPRPTYPIGQNHTPNLIIIGVHALDNEGKEDELPKIIDYCFSVDVSDLIFVMQDIGEKENWPRKGEKSRV